MRHTIKYIAAATCLTCAAWAVFSHSKTKRCTGPGGKRFDLATEGSCDHTVLYDVSERVHRVTNSHRLRGTRCGERIRMQWDGTINQLVDHGRAPAVTTGKEQIRVCLDGDPDVDALVFVVLHELAHVGCGEVGHTKAFWQTFHLLLEVAEKEGVYVNHDHDPDALVCGKRIGESPVGYF
jgi:hypothetical protein